MQPSAITSINRENHFSRHVGLIALWNKSDQWHTAALAAFESLDVKSTRFVSTPFLLLECANDAARKPYRSEVGVLRQQLVLAGDLIEPATAEIDDAWNQYNRKGAGAAGVIDLVSFAVMRRLGVLEAFTHDRHFVAAGFVTLF